MMNQFFPTKFYYFGTYQLKRAEVPNDSIILVNICLMDQF